MEADSGKGAVGRRIRDAAKAKGRENPTDLWELFLAEAKNRNLKQNVTRQTVSNWWHGKVYPSLDLLPALAGALGQEQEWILFGSKRGDQLRNERYLLSRVSEEEEMLLSAFRAASKSGQKTLLRQAQVIAEEQPAPEATVHPMRRKTDRLG